LVTTFAIRVGAAIRSRNLDKSAFEIGLRGVVADLTRDGSTGLTERQGGNQRE
jgi:hypothetical protein